MALRPAPPKVSDTEYASMTMVERATYAHSFTDEARQIKPESEMSPFERLVEQRARTDAYLDGYTQRKR